MNRVSHTQNPVAAARPPQAGDLFRRLEEDVADSIYILHIAGPRQYVLVSLASGIRWDDSSPTIEQALSSDWTRILPGETITIEPQP